jgi:DNA-directed RNA polymerase subunit RPC12/RpoP
MVAWRHGLGSRARRIEEVDMADDQLATFYARYPSALGNTHAGGQYRIICSECGHLVAVAVLDEQTRDIVVHCEHCGYHDEIVRVAAAISPAA